MYKASSGIIIPSKDKLEMLHNGRDGDIYRYLDYAVKFLKVDLGKNDFYMELEKLKQFIEIFSHELLASPKQIVYDNCQRYVAYLMNYIENKGIKSLSCDAFLESAENLRGCFDLFTENGIDAVDTHGRNILVNKKIFLNDFDRFIFVEKDANLVKNNNLHYEKLIWHIIQYAFFLSYNLNIPYSNGTFDRDDYYNWMQYIAPFDNWADKNGEKHDATSFFRQELRSYQTMEEYFLDRRDDIVKEYSLPF
jgi:hypothetical protein